MIPRTSRGVSPPSRTLAFSTQLPAPSPAYPTMYSLPREDRKPYTLFSSTGALSVGAGHYVVILAAILLLLKH